MTGWATGPWPAEDGGPARRQAATGPAPSGDLPAISRPAPGAAMAIVCGADDVYLYGSEMAAESVAWVERVDPRTLEPIARVEVPGGPWWPGGIAAHANGSLYVVHGRHVVRLEPDLSVVAGARLRRPRPYNSFVVLPDGHLVTKDLVLDGSEPSQLAVLDPEHLEPATALVDAPEPSVARLSADGDHLYVVGDHTIVRYMWDGRTLAPEDWSFRYRTAPDQSYAWDPVIAGGHVWFLDNGEHRYSGTMLGRGVATGPVHLVRVAVDDPSDHELVEVSGRASGAVTNPPLYDAERCIAIGYDSANGVLAAFDHDRDLRLRWRRPLATAGHLVHFPDDGALLAYDHTPEGEDVVLLDIESGTERVRIATGSPVQSVVFPAADGGGAVYYTSFTTVARIT